MSDRLSVGCRTFVVLLTLATLAVSEPCVARAAEEIDIAGEYSCRGGNPGGGIYSGKVVITKTGQTYKIQWTIGTGQVHVGVALLEGNVLSVCFASAEGVGVVAYKIQKGEDGLRLVGRWAGLGGQKTQSETLTRNAAQPKKGAEGPHRVTKFLSHPPAKAI